MSREFYRLDDSGSFRGSVVSEATVEYVSISCSALRISSVRPEWKWTMPANEQGRRLCCFPGVFTPLFKLLTLSCHLKPLNRLYARFSVRRTRR